MIIRILGTLLGLSLIIVFGYMLCRESGLLNIGSSLIGLLWGIVFLANGIGGEKSFLKILPHLVTTNVTK